MHGPQGGRPRQHRPRPLQRSRRLRGELAAQSWSSSGTSKARPGGCSAPGGCRGAGRVGAAQAPPRPPVPTHPPTHLHPHPTPTRAPAPPHAREHLMRGAAWPATVASARAAHLPPRRQSGVPSRPQRQQPEAMFAHMCPASHCRQPASRTTALGSIPTARTARTTSVCCSLPPPCATTSRGTARPPAPARRVWPLRGRSWAQKQAAMYYRTWAGGVKWPAR